MLNRYIIDLIFSLSTARRSFMFHENIQREKIYTIESGCKACFFLLSNIWFKSDEILFSFNIHGLLSQRERGSFLNKSVQHRVVYNEKTLETRYELPQNECKYM